MPFYFSIYRGYVADRKDPNKLGRLQLKIPMLWGDQVHEYWAYPKGLFSGSGMGASMIPEVGEMVWVQFEAGNIRYPVWSYGHWLSDAGIPEAYDDNGEPTRLVVKSVSGHTVILDDVTGDITIKQKDGSTFKLTKEHISLINSNNKGISLGKDGESAHPATLGDKNATVLTALRNHLRSLAQALAQDVAASSGSPYLTFANTATSVTQLLAVLAQMDTDITATKSTKVTLE